MDERLNGWRSVVILVTFLLTNLIVVFPFRVHLPGYFTRFLKRVLVQVNVLPRTVLATEHGGWSIPINYANLPVAAVVFLLATTSIDGVVVRKGIVGAEGIHPLDIMALFISLAYLAISLDSTGLLRFLAFWVARKAGTSGRKLYIYLYTFFFTSGVIIGNDPVVLSGTAFLAYLTKMTGIVPPTAWIFAQFAAANVASAVLVSSNPTNLVISGAFSLPYFVYSAYMILPALFAAIFMFAVLYAQFTFISRKRGTRVQLIPEMIVLPEGVGMDASQFLVDRNGAIVGSTLMLVTLAVLVATSPLKPTIPVWRITMPGAVLMLLRDLWWDWSRRKVRTTKEERVSVGDGERNGVGDGDMQQEEVELDEMNGTPGGRVEVLSPKNEQHPLEEDGAGSSAKKHPETTISPVPPSSTNSFSSHPNPPPDHTLSTVLANFHSTLSQTLPTTHHTLSNLPLALLPFAFSMFILVQGLVVCGWLDVFAAWWKKIEATRGVEGAVLVMIALSSLLCNVCGTNIGTTILIARVLQLSSQFSPSDPQSKGRSNPVVYALAFGTNVGAITFSFSASLAGLLWREILRQKGIHVTRREFALLNAVPWLVASVVGGVVLIVQYRVVR